MRKIIFLLCALPALSACAENYNSYDHAASSGAYGSPARTRDSGYYYPAPAPENRAMR